MSKITEEQMKTLADAIKQMEETGKVIQTTLDAIIPDLDNLKVVTVQKLSKVIPKSILMGYLESRRKAEIVGEVLDTIKDLMGEDDSGPTKH